MKDKKGSVEFTCTITCGECGKQEKKQKKGKDTSFSLYTYAEYIPDYPDQIWIYGEFGYDVICKECLEKIKKNVPAPLYHTGTKILDPVGNVGVIEFVYEYGKFERNKRSYAYSCRNGDGIVEESEIRLYDGDLKDNEISPLHPDNVTGEGIRAATSALSQDQE